MNNIEDLKKIETIISVKFTNYELLQQVFIHRSYLNEHKDSGLNHNERLEFLGDAVLELVVTEYLYKNFKEPEGVLTNWRSALVRGVSLSELAEKINIDKYMLLSKGESKSTGKGRRLILANAVEALIGAIYLDQGYEVASKFINNFLIIKLEEIIKNQSYIDSKSKFQELAQEKYAITPHYELISESGPDHDKLFVVGVYILERKLGEGSGSSKQSAEQDAAKNALSDIDQLQ